MAERLEQKLDDDYLLWYDVPVGPKYSHPDFVVMHPRRGLLVLEIKDWRLATIWTVDKETLEIIPDGIPKASSIPLNKPANTPTKSSIHWNVTHSWCNPMANIKES